MPARGSRGGPRLVTLSSDVGAAYAAQMKAVLARSVDPSRIIDLVHELPRHGVGEAAFVVRAIGRGFPAGSVHVVVVDPGVGGSRAPIAISCRDGSVLVGPDNGVLLPLAEALGGTASTVRIDPKRLGTRTRVGTTFDGRDVFAPAAALLALGTPTRQLGVPIVPVPYQVPVPHKGPGGARGVVVHVDRFGNLITNVPTSWVRAPGRRVRLRVGSVQRTAPWTRSYEALAPRQIGAMGSSFGTVEIAVREGDAAARLRARAGTAVSFAWERATRHATETVSSERPR